MSVSVEVIKRGLAAFATRDLETWRECFDPDVEVTEDSSIPDAGSYHGHEGLMVWLGVMEHNWEDFEAHGEAFVEAGDDVVTLVRVCGRGKTSQIEIEGRFGNIFTVREGQVVRWRIYASWADALGAAGLRE
jgi:ketosteroid isomerase-like protein